MEIPNYDNTNKNRSNFKQLYSYMPDSCFRMLICGNSGSGKTNVLIHMLKDPLIYYDKIYLYAKNLEQDKYQYLIECLEKIARQIKRPVEDLLEVSNDEIIDLDDIENDDNQKVVIFDDYICDANQNKIIKYFIGGRHKNCSVIYLSQSYYKTPKDIRLNCSHYILFESPGKKENNMIAGELNIDKEKYKKATKKQYDFLYLDQPRKVLARNYYGEL